MSHTGLAMRHKGSAMSHTGSATYVRTYEPQGFGYEPHGCGIIFIIISIVIVVVIIIAILCINGRIKSHFGLGHHLHTNAAEEPRVGNYVRRMNNHLALLLDEGRSSTNLDDKGRFRGPRRWQGNKEGPEHVTQITGGTYHECDICGHTDYLEEPRSDNVSVNCERCGAAMFSFEMPNEKNGSKKRDMKHIDEMEKIGRPLQGVVQVEWNKRTREWNWISEEFRRQYETANPISPEDAALERKRELVNQQRKHRKSKRMFCKHGRDCQIGCVSGHLRCHHFSSMGTVASEPIANTSTIARL